jgi:maleate isomerase
MVLMVDTLGYRRKIGIVAPAANTVVTADAAQCSLTGVTYQFSDVPAGADDPDAETARRILQKQPAGVAAMFDHLLWAADGTNEISRLFGGLPVVMAREALAHAFAVSGYSRNIALLTPFPPEQHRMACATLERDGFTIVAERGLDLPFADQPHIRFVDQRAALAPMIGDDVGTIVQLGHNMPFGRLVDNIEEDHGRPALAVNHVTFWKLLRDLGVEDVIPGVGRLFIDH